MVLYYYLHWLWVWSACLVCLFQPAQGGRARRILSLIPNIEADSCASESSSEDEALPKALSSPQLSSGTSSPAPSIDSSLERLNLLDKSDNSNDSPISPILREVFPEPSQCNYNAIPSISSIPSLPSVQEPDTNIPSLPPPETPKIIHRRPALDSQPTYTLTPEFSNGRSIRKRKALKPLSVNTKRLHTEKFKLNFKWKKTRLQHRADISKPVFIEQLPSDWSALDYFHYFFPKSLIEDIVTNTNLYSVQELGRSIKVNSEEMTDFLAINILMGIVDMPSYKDYWKISLRYAKIADLMSLKRFQQIRRYIHFVNNNEADTSDRYYKLRPFIEKVRERCLSVEEENAFSVDEMIIPYKGKKAGSRRQYNPNKPCKWGFKNIVRAGVSGIVYDFVLYAGDDTFRQIEFTSEETNLGVGAKMVLALCKSIKNPACVVYFDNYFTSLELVYLLRENYGIFSLGTVRKNRLRDGNTLLMSDETMKKKGRGSSCQIVCNDTKLAIVKWYDNKAVTLVSSYVDSHPMNKIKRFSKNHQSRIDFDCPQIVKHYNRHMGGVDLADMLISLYRTGLKSHRWYLNIFSQIMDICINNAWLLRRRQFEQANVKNNNDRLKDFRYEVYAGLVKGHRHVAVKDVPTVNENKKIKKPVAERPVDAVRFDRVDHWPIHTGYGRCKFCKGGQSNTKCNKCNVHLCFVKTRNCFVSYHVPTQ